MSRPTVSDNVFGPKYSSVQRRCRAIMEHSGNSERVLLVPGMEKQTFFIWREGLTFVTTLS
jgi:hypothetical protein